MNGGPPWWENTRPHPYTHVIPDRKETPVPSTFVASTFPWAVRTFVPWIVAYLVGVLPAQLGITESALTTGVTFVIGLAYAAVARILETYVDPRFGVLLGWIGPAAYERKDTAA